jgi:HEAT repeat protein
MDVSVIIRFHNEAPYLESTLRAVKAQHFPVGEFEICAVDDGSTDGSRAIAERYADQLLQIKTYRPGRALNMAIAQARGRYIAVLSAHTIPANRDWLYYLWAHQDSSRLLAVYGGQLYNLNSKFLDKRDLDIFSTLEPRLEIQDSDLWNANSMFPRERWQEQSFDDSVYELEDHHWAKVMLARGYEVHFEPRALVYHYSHIERLDREYLPASELTEREQIEQAIAELEDPAADWPRVMVAGLTLASLTRSPLINRAVPALGKHLTEHWDFDVRWRMAQALGKIPHVESVGYLVTALEDPSFYPRDEAAWSLIRLGALAVPAIRRVVSRLPTASRPFAALALGLSGVAEAQTEAVKILDDELAAASPSRRRDAAYFAGEIAAPETVSLVSRIATLLESDADSDAELCKVACWALGCFATFEASIDWQQIRGYAQRHGDPLVRFEALVALGKGARRNNALLNPLVAGYGDAVGRVRYGVVQSLRLLAEDGMAVPLPEGLLYDDDFGVQYEGRCLEACRESSHV